MAVHDVIIAGAGPAGSTLATLLARAGHAPMLLDRARFPRDKTCGDFVSPRGLAMLRELGCLAEIDALPLVPLRGCRVFLGDRFLSSGPIPALPEFEASARAVPRRDLDDILFRQARRAGTETVEDCRVLGFETERDRVVVHATRGGHRARFTGRLVVGADGVQSVVARTAGLAVKDPSHLMASARAYCEGLELDDTVLYFDPDFFPGFGWVFPTSPGRANLGAGLVVETSKRFDLRLRAFFDRTVTMARRLAREQGRELVVDSSIAWPIRTFGGVKRNAFEQGLLVGEAGSFVDPMSGEGIPLAMETARIAAGVVSDAFRGQQPLSATLAGYDDRCRERYRLDLGISDVLLTLVRNRHLVDVWVTGFEILNATAARDPVLAATFGGVLAGVIPNREVLRPETLARALTAAMAELADHPVGSAPSLLELIDAGSRIASRQLDALQGMLDSPDWTLSWLGDLAGKQLDLLQAWIDASRRT